jgi:GNAT superfamily N-acetyltransferase
MDDGDLGALQHENWIAYLEGAIACGDNALVARDHGIVTLLSGVPMRLFNQVLVEEADASGEAILRGVSRARERGDPFVVHLRDGTDDRFMAVARAAGLVSTGLEGAMPGMAWHPIGPEGLRTRTEPGFEIRQVTDEAGVAQHTQTLTDGFGTNPAVALGVMCVDLARRDGWAVYVGYHGGDPVSIGLGLRTGHTIGVYNIATLERARGHGFGQAITARVVADGVAAGCDVAILQASSMGFPIYERMGFRVTDRYVGWIDADRAG